MLTATSPSADTQAVPDKIMGWLCPACQAAIEHQEPKPRLNVIYCCPICRLELVRDAKTGELVLAPIEPPAA